MTPSALLLPARPALAPDVAREIDTFEAEMQRFLEGDLAPERFRAFRLGHGVYGQRQPGVQMVRVKIPGGGVTSAQMRRLADVAERFGNGRVHLTTRQDLQMHYVPLESVPQVLRLIAEAGLTTREACGNSVRNVTACPLSGEIADEVFPVHAFANATYAYLVRNAFCQQMARKFKIAFSGCPEDCAATAIHDIGATARVVVEGGRAHHGFRLVAGGGLGPTPFVAQPLEEFVPIEELLPTVRAVLEVFSAQGNRRQKARARLKFVVHRLGIEAFREETAAARAALSASEIEEADIRRWVPAEHAGSLEALLAGETSRESRERAVTPADRAPFAAAGQEEDPDLARWISFNVRAHRDPSLAIATVLLPLGDLDSAALRAVADLADEHAGGVARIARDQNLVLPRVRLAEIPALHAGLRAAGLAEAGAGTALDVTACPGADTCSLGITSSKGLTRALREELTAVAGNGDLDALRGVSIKISGCPNSCGQHHVAGIGLHGVVRKIGGRSIPAYQIHLGGRASGGPPRIAAALDKIPARRVPEAVASVLAVYRAERAPGEGFSEFAQRQTEERLRHLVRPFAEEVGPAESLAYDWGQSDPFSTEEMGTGECAGAGTDAAVHPFDGVEAELTQTRLLIEARQWADALANLNRVQYSIARVLLERIGKKPDSDYQVACELRAHVIDRGHGADSWEENHRAVKEAMRPRHPAPDDIERIYGAALDLLEDARRSYEVLGRARSASAGEAAG